jgi:hypothetical protein
MSRPTAAISRRVLVPARRSAHGCQPVRPVKRSAVPATEEQPRREGDSLFWSPEPGVSSVVRDGDVFPCQEPSCPEGGKSRLRDGSAVSRGLLPMPRSVRHAARWPTAITSTHLQIAAPFIITPTERTSQEAFPILRGCSGAEHQRGEPLVQRLEAAVDQRRRASTVRLAYLSTFHRSLR